MRLNPFRGLDNPREVFAWGLYDLANQSFTLLIITLLFPIYFRGVVVGDESRGEALWAVLGPASLLLVVIASPVLGATADGFGIRKRLLIGTGVACGVLTCALGFVGPGQVWLAAIVFVAANFLYQVGENFLASFLTDVSTPRNIGRVSATGWTMGYVGALLLLVITAVAMLLFGLDVPRWGPLFVLAGLWFLGGIIAPAIILRETPPQDAEARRRGAVVVAAQRLRETARNAAGFKQLIRFLLAFFIYAFGVQTVINFAGLIANDFGFNQTKLVLFVLQLTVTAGVASALTGKFQDHIGARTTLFIYLGIWIVSSIGLGLLSIPADAAVWWAQRNSSPGWLVPYVQSVAIAGTPEWLFWIIGNGIGLGLGGIGTASRAIVGRFTPKQKTAEFFGLWGMTYKLAGVVGITGFGQVKAWIGDTASMVVLTAFFVTGFLLLLRVDEIAGVREARRAERADGTAPLPPHLSPPAKPL